MNEKTLVTKVIVIFTTILLFAMSVVPSTAVQESIDKQLPLYFDGDILYVGGSGPNNYTTIQSAIDDAIDGDTVYVYDDSSPYKESVVVDKMINLIGEHRNTTIIENEYYGIDIEADDVFVSNFSIIAENCIGIDGNNVCISNNILNFVTEGITLWTGNSAIITGNIITGGLGVLYPILIKEGSNHLISGNSITSGDVWPVYACICFEGVDESTISNNNISLTSSIIVGDGIAIIGSNNIIENNKIFECSTGIDITGNLNVINSNDIRNCNYGVILRKSRFNTITNNNIIDVESLKNCFRILSFGNTWDGNYWNQPRISPYIVRGYIGFLIPWFNFDWNPAQEPYDI